jgi:hypothetical protein
MNSKRKYDDVHENTAIQIGESAGIFEIDFHTGLVSILEEDEMKLRGLVEESLEEDPKLGPFNTEMEVLAVVSDVYHRIQAGKEIYSTKSP